MAVLLLPDNTILVNFGHIDRIPLLRHLALAHAWCAAVADECERSARQPGLGSLDQARAIFGAPLRPDPAEHQDTQVLRQRMAAPGDSNTKHLGEAETISIVARRRLPAIFATDDRDAALHARAAGITVISTWDLLRIARKLARITANEAWTDCVALRSLGRGGPPCGTGRANFDAWLD